MRYFNILFLLCIFSFSLHAAMYKWVDEDGNVHYTQTRPDADVEVKEIKPPPKVDSEAVRQEHEQQKQMVDKLTKERKKAAEEEQTAADEIAQKAAKCQQARARLASYQRPKVNVKQPDGSLRALSEEERQAEITKSRNYIDKFCN